jgi:hypothetical protein
MDELFDEHNDDCRLLEHFLLRLRATALSSPSKVLLVSVDKYSCNRVRSLGFIFKIETFLTKAERAASDVSGFLIHSLGIL